MNSTNKTLNCYSDLFVSEIFNVDLSSNNGVRPACLSLSFSRLLTLTLT